MFKSKYYSLEIISQHPQFRNRPLKKYGIDGVDTVGAWGDEPFEIKFKNNSGNRVQVKVSVDGTDVLSGDPATTEADSQMWLVNGYGTLQLKAWPESKNGGASFVFTSANNSVALHTHGDMSNRGIIAVAVFEEGYIEPVRLNYHDYDYRDYGRRYRKRLDLTTKSICRDTKSADADVDYSFDEVAEPATYSSNSIDTYEGRISESSVSNSLDRKSLASVGAGSYVDQRITYTKGLTKPVLATTLKVKYVWWDDLKAKLESMGYTNNDPDGFPGDASKKMIDLKSTPRIDTTRPKYGAFRRAPQELISRF